jgi:hypothetical protein
MKAGGLPKAAAAGRRQEAAPRWEEPRGRRRWQTSRGSSLDPDSDADSDSDRHWQHRPPAGARWQEAGPGRKGACPRAAGGRSPLGSYLDPDSDSDRHWQPDP